MKNKTGEIPVYFSADSQPELKKWVDELPTAVNVTMGGLTVEVDPAKHTNVLYQGRVVGHIKGTRWVHDSLIADVVITEPDILKLINPTPPSVSFNERAP